MKKLLSLTVSSLLLSGVAAANIPEIESSRDTQNTLSLTIYNDSLALINDYRTLFLKAGMNTVLLKDVSGQIRSETSQLIPIKGDFFQVIEQNFDYDLLSPQAMLQKAVGYEIDIITANPTSGEETIEKATVLANNSGLVLQYADRIETNLNPNARISFPSIPKNLRATPTLSILLSAKNDGERDVELTYLSHGFGWKADYVANLAKDNKSLDLTGWITLTNNSGTTFNNASVQLVAGDINQVAQSGGQMRSDIPLMAKQMDSALYEVSAEMESFSDYHLYSLPFKTTINNNQTKQVSLFTATAIPVIKEYRFNSYESFYSNYATEQKNVKARVYLKLENTEENNIGMPIPKGVFRIYQENSKDQPLFVGEDNINHIAKNEKFELYTGEAFDVSLSRKQTNFTSISKHRSQSSHEIIFNNAKTEPVTINLYESFNNFTNWTILKESHPHIKSDAKTSLWEITIPAEDKVTLTYTVEHRLD